MDDIKLYWELYEKWFSNEALLNGFYNPLKFFITGTFGNIIDIGCGPSPHILDMLDSKYNLYALDKDQLQLDALKRRIVGHGYPETRVKFQLGEFDTNKYHSIEFDGIVLSNLLHFMSLFESSKLINQLELHIRSGTLILVVVHSDRHPKNAYKNGSDDYFKHFYSATDLEALFPDELYDYLYISQTVSFPDNRQVGFLKDWIKTLAESKQMMPDKESIQQLQLDYLNKAATANITLLARRK